MSTNLFSRLKRMLPDSPVLVGLVVAHHDDDTSTVLLPLEQGQQGYSNGVESGSLIRARGTFVPVGERAFVRDGVIETKAPSGTAQPIPVGRVVDIPLTLAFNGPIPDQTLTVGAAFTLALAPFWTGGLAPQSWALTSGTLPAGLTLNAATGVISGTPTTAGVLSGLVFRVTEAAGAQVSSNAVAMTVIPAAPLFAGPIPGLSRVAGTSFSVSLASYWSQGSAPLSYSLASGSLPAGVTLNSSTGVLSGTAASTTGSPFTGLVVRATDAIGRTADSNSFTLTITPALAVSGTFANQSGTVGTFFSAGATGWYTGGTAPITVTLNGGTLPAGISVAGNSLSGTPSAAGTSTGLTLRATDSLGASVVSNTFTFTVTAAYTSATVLFDGTPLPSGVTKSSSNFQEGFDIDIPSDGVGVGCGVFNSGGGSVTVSKASGFITRVRVHQAGPSGSLTVNVYAETGGGGALLAAQSFSDASSSFVLRTVTFSGVGKSVVISGPFNYFVDYCELG